MVHRSESEINLDNIVFEDRNRAYGAYFIRKVYNDHLKDALIISVCVFSLAIAAPILYRLVKPADKEEVVVEDVVVELSEPPPLDETKPPPPPPPPIEPPKIATTQFLPPKIMEDDKVKEEIEPPKQEQLKEAPPAAKTQEGDANIGEVIEPSNPVVEAKEEVPVTWVGEQEKFAGDLAKFFAAHITYPDKAKDQGIEGKVFVEFVIEKDGSVTGVRVAKGIGGGCDEMALKAVQATNGKWSPGKNNGHPVRLKKILPVVFKLPQD